MAEKTTTTPPADPAPAADAPVAPAPISGVVLNLPKADASPPEVLELKPNRWADAQSGPHEQIDPLTYVTMTAPDGHQAIVPLSNVEHYEGKGFTKGASQQIEDIVAYHAEKAQQAPASS